MKTSVLAVLVAAAFVCGCAASTSMPLAGDAERDVAQEVSNTERAFAKTMANRDHEAFASFIADDAIFFSGADPIRGKQSVVDSWAPFFEGPDAPFSWEPALVEVLESGTLALSSGPVRDAGGKTIAQFTSIWRREAAGTWRIVFDKGNNVCDCAPSRPRQ
jgi:ketosteroid isomerase-like protein